MHIDGLLLVAIACAPLVACGSDVDPAADPADSSDGLDVAAMAAALNATPNRDDLARCPVVGDTFADELSARADTSFEDGGASVTGAADSFLGQPIVRCSWSGTGPDPDRGELVVTSGEEVSAGWFEALTAEDDANTVGAWRPALGGQVRTDELPTARCRSVWIAPGVMLALETRVGDGGRACVVIESFLIARVPEVGRLVAEL